jgi:hypothetical protein
MEASDGLNPVSSQGYAEVNAVEAHQLAAAGQISIAFDRPFKDIVSSGGGSK